MSYQQPATYAEPHQSRVLPSNSIRAPHESTPLEQWSIDQFGAIKPNTSVSKRALLAAVVVGITAAVCFRHGIAGVGMGLVVFVVITSISLVAARVVVKPSAIGGLVCAVLLAGLWLFRESGWVRGPAFLGIALCLTAAASFGCNGSMFDQQWLQVAGRALVACIQLVISPYWLCRGAVTRFALLRSARITSVVRALMITIPTLVVLFVLLRSSDPVFAQFLNVSIGLGDIASDVVWFILGACLSGGLTALALMTNPAAPTRRRQSLIRSGEARLVLAGITALFALYVGVQAFESIGVGRATLEERGVKFSDYARSGYFQLLAVMVITVVLLTTIDAIGPQPHRKRYLQQQVLSIGIVLLTLCIALVAMRRLQLYCDAYGLTMLRLACAAAAVWMAALLLLIAGWILGIARTRHWLPALAGLVLVATAFSYGAINPESVVVKYDTQHASPTGFDIHYLARLSDDATPQLVEAVKQLKPPQSEAARQVVCQRVRASQGWAQSNTSFTQATKALESLCSPK